jgi:hypothetical protein
MTSALSSVRRDPIIALAARHKLPAVYFERNFVVAGGLPEMRAADVSFAH